MVTVALWSVLPTMLFLTPLEPFDEPAAVGGYLSL